MTDSESDSKPTVGRLCVSGNTDMIYSITMMLLTDEEYIYTR